MAISRDFHRTSITINHHNHKDFYHHQQQQVVVVVVAAATGEPHDARIWLFSFNLKIQRNTISKVLGRQSLEGKLNCFIYVNAMIIHVISVVFAYKNEFKKIYCGRAEGGNFVIH